MGKKFILVFLGICVIMLSSCNGKDIAISSEKSYEQNNSDFIKKYNAYVQVNNFMYESLNEDLNYYNKAFGLDIRIFDKNIGSIVISSVPTTELDMIMEKINFYKIGPVIESVDTVAKDLAPAIKDIASILSDTEFYYASKNYVDDEFEEGRALHAKICTSYGNYESKKVAFTAALKKQCYEQSQKDMEIYLENNESIKYHTISYILTAIDLFDILENQNINNENILAIDIKNFKEKYNTLAEGIDQLVYEANATSNEKKQFESHNFNDFIDYAQKTKASADDILKSLDKQDSSLCLLEKFYSNLRTMIFYYNRVVYFSNDIKNLNYFPTI